MEVVPNLFWIEGRASNIYVWRSEPGLLMVDTGMPGDAKRILDAMRENDLDAEDVAAILITHADIDHAGGAAIIMRLKHRKVNEADRRLKRLTITTFFILKVRARISTNPQCGFSHLFRRL